MATTIVVHSFMRDSRKTFITSQLASLAVAEGKRVGVIEADVLMPELHRDFQLDPNGMGLTLNDFLLGRCALEDAAVDLGNRQGLMQSGSLVFIPASTERSTVSDVLQARLDVMSLQAGFAAVIEKYGLDLLFINAPAGLDEVSLSCIALADILIVVLCLDEEDTHGTSVTLDLAKRLNIHEVLLVVNRVGDKYDLAAVKREVETVYGFKTPVALTIADESEMRFSNSASSLDRSTNPLAPLLKEIYAQA